MIKDSSNCERLNNKWQRSKSRSRRSKLRPIKRRTKLMPLPKWWEPKRRRSRKRTPKPQSNRRNVELSNLTSSKRNPPLKPI